VDLVSVLELEGVGSTAFLVEVEEVEEVFDLP
jgi:hypothetical protein